MLLHGYRIANNSLSFFLIYPQTANFALVVKPNLEPIIAIFAIYGCLMTNLPTIVAIAAFVEWAVEKTFVTVMTVECVSIPSSLTITIARLENTCPTVPSVKKICLVLEMPRTKCPVGMPFIGIASKNSPRTTHGVPSVKRRRKPRNTWPRHGRPWPWGLPCNRYRQSWREWLPSCAMIANNEMWIDDGIFWESGVLGV